jgi:FkbM family methyltransferase
MSAASAYRKARKIASIVRHPQYRHGLRFAVAPAIEHEAMLRSLPPLATIVDVGANRGQFALVARRFHPEARITAFEPLPRAGDRFARIFAQNQGVVLHRVALGSRSADAELNVSSRDDSSSLLPITDLQEATFPGTGLSKLESVKVRRLGRVLSSANVPGPALMKVDVQGGELDVLMGAEDLLGAFDFVCVEVSFVEFYSGQPLAHQVLRFMEESSFRLSGVYNPFLDARGRSVQADFLFTRTEPVAPGRT